MWLVLVGNHSNAVSGVFRVCSFWLDICTLASPYSSAPYAFTVLKGPAALASKALIAIILIASMERP